MPEPSRCRACAGGSRLLCGWMKNFTWRGWRLGGLVRARAGTQGRGRQPMGTQQQRGGAPRGPILAPPHQPGPHCCGLPPWAQLTPIIHGPMASMAGRGGRGEGVGMTGHWRQQILRPRCRAHDRSVVRATPSRLFDPFAANCRHCVDGGDDVSLCKGPYDSCGWRFEDRTGNTSWRGLAPTPFYLAGRDEFDDPWAGSQFRGCRCVEARRPSPLRFRSAGTHLGAGGGGGLSVDYMVDLVRSRFLSLGLPFARQRHRGDRRGSAAAGTMGILPLIDRGFPLRCSFRDARAPRVFVWKSRRLCSSLLPGNASRCHDTRRRLWVLCIGGGGCSTAGCIPAFHGPPGLHTAWMDDVVCQV